MAFASHRSRRFRPVLDRLPQRLAPADICPMDPVVPPDPPVTPVDPCPMDPVLISTHPTAKTRIVSC